MQHNLRPNWLNKGQILHGNFASPSSHVR